MTATIDDGSALFDSIAGISFMPGTVVDLNVMPVAPSIDFAGLGDPYPSNRAKSG